MLLQMLYPIARCKFLYAMGIRLRNYVGKEFVSCLNIAMVIELNFGALASSLVLYYLLDGL